MQRVTLKKNYKLKWNYKYNQLTQRKKEIEKNRKHKI